MATTKGHSSSSYRLDLWDHRPVKAFSVLFYGKFVLLGFIEIRVVGAFISRELLLDSLATWSEFICDSLNNIFGENQTDLTDSRYSLLDSTGFLASQLIAILAVIICGLVWMNCPCIFGYCSNSTSYSYSSLLRYLYCRFK